MKICDRCKIKFGYIEYANHRCYSVKEWKKLSTNPVRAETNDFQFINFKTQRKESYDFITSAEVILDKYTIYIFGHVNRKKVGKMCTVPFKERLKSGLKNLPSKITQKNFDKGMKVFDESMASFSKEMDSLTKGLGGNSKSSGSDKIWGKKKTSVDIWGKKNQKASKKSSKSPQIKIWSEPKKKTKKKRKSSKSDTWDQNEKNLDKIWGKKK